MFRIRHKPRTLYALLLGMSALALSTILLLVDPGGKSLIYIFIPILLSWLLLFSIGKLLLFVFYPKHHSLHTYIVLTLVSMAVLLLLLSGIGQLRVVDIVLITSLTLIIAFYFYRSWG